MNGRVRLANDKKGVGIMSLTQQEADDLLNKAKEAIRKEVLSWGKRHDMMNQ